MADSTEAVAGLNTLALDPARSVVVEACAGSGKTWLLAARVVRLLLAGVAPGEILAITFTRKAAREIEERVFDWLRLLATADEATAIAFLRERGVAADAAILRRARGLFERALAAQPGLTVNTFHGWFLQLVAAAPLSANLAGTTLVAGGARLFDECWQNFATRLVGTAADSPAGLAFRSLLETIGQDATRELLRRGLDRRAEWLIWLGEGGEPGIAPVSAALASLRADFGLPAASIDAAPADDRAALLAGFFAAGWETDFHAYLGFLEQSSLKTDLALAQNLRAALADAAGVAIGSAGSSGDETPAQTRREALADAVSDPASASARLAALREVFFTAAGGLRARKESKALNERFGVDGAARFLTLHAELGARVGTCVARLADAAAYAFNRDALLVLDTFLAEVEEFKATRRIIDFADAEWRVLQLLRDDDNAAYVQAKLDARYSHVLLDEFQDANPLQWQILLAWFGAYSDAARPAVFLVGDPKQSIYRFRRAEPRLFAAAGDFLATHFAAARCALDATRRNAQPIVDVVNALFAGEELFQPFRQQLSAAGELPGRVELLPLFGEDEGAVDASAARKNGEPPAAAAGEGESTTRLRDPLREPAAEKQDTRRQREAVRLAETLRAIVGRWQIVERDGRCRLARYGDILLLARTRTQLAIYERELAAAGIPFVGAARGGLLQTLEARDIAALLTFLVNPADDLALAQTLASPLFACGDDELLALAARPEAGWWARLCQLAATPVAPPTLVRAAQLLADWREAAARLPAHDLLDRIYHQGQLRERYRQAVPAALVERVDANLRALLLLALDLDGGRYPSLPRFIDELRALVDVADDEAPDEGVIDAPLDADDGSRVRILTIHGAKGLEAPIVWLLDANGSTRPESGWQPLVEWLPEEAAPRHFSIRGNKELRGAAREPLFAAEAAAAAREELNLLYVAITRARQVFIASGIAGRKDSETTPYRRLQRALAALAENAAAAEVGEDAEGEALAHGDLADGWSPLTGCLAPGLATAAPLSAAGDKAAAEQEVSEETAAPVAMRSVGLRRPAASAGERFGVLLHALIERRTGLPAEDGWWRALGFSDDEYRAVQPAAGRMLNSPSLRRFFDASCYRQAWNELDLGAADGRLLRLDRLVEFADADGDPGELWVLDYKSSSAATPRLPEYRQQVADYCRIVAAVFPGRPVRGLLAFASGECIEVDANEPAASG
ncbi:UvrD-helicase domain-containing protein [Rhodocyclus tenuis]|uniref:DNA 3'-5' helicase n=1 Tax=Rhodocyclus tenuis TaxID=1066 RepID=A0A840G1H0_RHOTE|nr:UvrD-helicase domain-containing protein [Rhodocyclus tenuis]MBB4248104.1 ATP-dependent helicase/nuclease subunit A [Rhodocyclus tenuis]